MPRHYKNTKKNIVKELDRILEEIKKGKNAEKKKMFRRDYFSLTKQLQIKKLTELSDKYEEKWDTVQVSGVKRKRKEDTKKDIKKPKVAKEQVDQPEDEDVDMADERTARIATLDKEIESLRNQVQKYEEQVRDINRRGRMKKVPAESTEEKEEVDVQVESKEDVPVLRQKAIEEEKRQEDEQKKKVVEVPVSATSQAAEAMPVGPTMETEEKSAEQGAREMAEDGGERIHVDEDLEEKVAGKVRKEAPSATVTAEAQIRGTPRPRGPTPDVLPEKRKEGPAETSMLGQIRGAPIPRLAEDVAVGDQPQAGPAQPRHMGRPTMEAPPAQEQAERQRVGQAYEEKMDVQDDERKEDAPPQEQPKPPGMPAGPPEEFIQERFAYPDAPPHHLGIKAVPPSMDLDMEKRQRMSKSIDVLKMEIKCFRELYKGKIRTKKYMELAKINMTQKSLDEVRKIHKQYSDIIRDYYTHSRGLRVGVIVDPAILGLNVSALQGLLAPRVPSYAPVVNAAREGDKLYPKGERDKQQAAIRIAETHYQQGGMRHATGDYDRDVEAINRSIDKEEIRKEKNRSTTRLPGKLPVYKNYMYRARPTQIASGIKINTS